MKQAEFALWSVWYICWLCALQVRAGSKILTLVRALNNDMTCCTVHVILIPMHLLQRKRDWLGSMTSH